LLWCTRLSLRHSRCGTAAGNTTIFPPYFYGGCVYSSFAMVLTLAIPSKFYTWKIGLRWCGPGNMATVMLATARLWLMGNGMEVFMAWFFGQATGILHMWNRMFGRGLGILDPYPDPTSPIPPDDALVGRQAAGERDILFILSLIVNTG